MEALDVFSAPAPVITFWEGEIVDNVNHFFLTRRWGAEMGTDISHWRKFQPFVESGLAKRFEAGTVDEVDLSTLPYVFMRWKERFFVSPERDCGLTICGFYYSVISTATGNLLAVS